MANWLRFSIVIAFVLMLATFPSHAAGSAVRELFNRAAKAQAASGITFDSTYAPRIYAFIHHPFDIDSYEPDSAEYASFFKSPISTKGHTVGEGQVGRAANWYPSPAVLVTGLRDFVVARARDELVYALLREERQRIRKHPFLRVAFPRCDTLLARLDAETFGTLTPALRSAAAADLEALPVTIGSREFIDASGWSASRRDAAQLVAAVFQCARAVTKGTSPGSALSTLVQVDSTRVFSRDTRFGLRVVGRLSSEYARMDSTRIALTLSSEALRSYLIALAGRDEAASPEWTDNAWKAAAVRHLERSGDAMMAFFQGLEDLRRSSGPLADRDDQFTRSLRTASSTLSCTKAMVVLAANERVPGTVAGALDDSGMLLLAASKHDYVSIARWFIERGNSSWNGPVVHVVLFAGNLASAESSDDVSTVLRTASAPVGTYRVKRRPGRVVVSLTSYPGLIGANENTDGFPGGEHANFAGGLTIPIGFEISLGQPLRWSPLGSLSAFFPVLDLGTIATGRKRSDSVRSEAEIGWEQIVAPGGFVVIGVGRLPLAVGVGAQYVQRLRSNAATGTEVNVVRFGVFASIDATFGHL